MDDLKVIFYVVVAIVWMIYNNYKKVAETAKKRDPSKPDPEIIEENWPKPVGVPKPQASKKQVVDWGDSYEKPNSQQKRGKIERAPLFKPKMATKKRAEPLFLSTIEGGMPHHEEIVPFEDSIDIVTDKNSWLFQIKNADFKQGIVLSEILQRPYN